MDLALLLKLAAPPVSISVAVQNIVVMLAIVVVGLLCYFLIENFIGVCPDLAYVTYTKWWRRTYSLSFT